VRVDATRSPGGAGIGHAMRCLNLSRAWMARGGSVQVLTTGLPDVVSARYRVGGLEVLPPVTGVEAGGGADAALVLDHVRQAGPAWVVADGYHFGKPFRSAVGRSARLLIIDDHARTGAAGAAIVLDQNVDAGADAYADREAGCRLLLGSRFALVDPAFAERGRRERGGPTARVLIVLGGGPRRAWVARVAAAAERLAGGGLAVRVVGATRTGVDKGVTWCGFSADVVAEMRDADICVAAAGSTTWEICCAGLPALLTSVADNQVPVARAISRAGAAIDLGWWEELTEARIVRAARNLADDADRRAVMAAKAMALVDGEGSRRVVDELWPRLALRLATHEDARLLWEWANDPVTRRASFSTAPIPWEDHLAWLTTHLASATSLLLVGTDDAGEPVGQIRFEKSGAVAEVHVSVAPGRRGQGYGATLVRVGAVRAFGHWGDIREVVGLVKVDNTLSVGAFKAAGFEQVQARVPGPSEPVTQWRLRQEDTDVRR
jgi:spore coat polysaccharide biosynthesis predicted glycosyltransferase SpsG/RimJ/RimL family protein N-acetyltransferase